MTRDLRIYKDDVELELVVVGVERSVISEDRTGIRGC